MSTFDIKQATEDYTKTQCPSQFRDVAFGQLEFKVGCYRSDNPTAAGIKCSNLMSMIFPPSTTCASMSPGWEKSEAPAKRDVDLNCFWICDELHTNANVTPSSSPSIFEPAPKISDGLHVNINLTLNFAALCVLFFMMFNLKY